MLREGETYPLPRDMTRADGLSHWLGPECERTVFGGVAAHGFCMSDDARGAGLSGGMHHL
jgi:hypothetical protein